MNEEQIQEVEKAKHLLKGEAARAREVLVNAAAIENAHNKPIISTMINTSALALTSLGILQITQAHSEGYIALASGMTLEFLKYYGMKLKLW